MKFPATIAGDQDWLIAERTESQIWFRMLASRDMQSQEAKYGHPGQAEGCQRGIEADFS
jgi:hypothetical protein